MDLFDIEVRTNLFGIEKSLEMTFKKKVTYRFSIMKNLTNIPPALEKAMVFRQSLHHITLTIC